MPRQSIKGQGKHGKRIYKKTKAEKCERVELTVYPVRIILPTLPEILNTYTRARAHITAGTACYGFPARAKVYANRLTGTHPQPAMPWYKDRTNKTAQTQPCPQTVGNIRLHAVFFFFRLRQFVNIRKYTHTYNQMCPDPCKDLMLCLCSCRRFLTSCIRVLCPRAKRPIRTAS